MSASANLRRFAVIALVPTIAGELFAQASAAPSTLASAAVTTSVAGVSTSDFSWLAGTWEGKLAGLPDAIAEVTFQPPRAGTLTGVMRLAQGEKLLVIELISMVDTPRGLEMRFRHFNGALEAMEPTFKQTMLLKSHEATKDVFENLDAYDKTLMSTQPRVSSWMRRGPDDMIAQSDIIGGDGKPAVVEVTYHRRKTP